MGGTVEPASDISPFQVDCRMRLWRTFVAASRRRGGPSKELVPDRSQGVRLSTLQELARYWVTDYDWRKAEAKVNALPQFTTEIDRVNIHFIHVQSPHAHALPLIITHGWPGSVVELLETVGPLTDPTARGGEERGRVHLVLPSLPGYGFSGEPTDVGWEPSRTARAWAELMLRPRLHPLSRPGWRRRRRRGRRAGPAGAGGCAAPHEPAGAGAGGGCHAERPPTRNTPRPRSSPPSAVGNGYSSRWPRVRRRSDTPCWIRRWRWRPGSSTRHQRLLQDRQRVRRREPPKPHPRPHPRQHHAVLADRHRRVPARSYWEAYGPDAPAAAAALAIADDPVGSRPSLVDLADSPKLGRSELPNVIYSTQSTRAATSPPGRSRSSSPTKCAQHSFAPVVGCEEMRSSQTPAGIRPRPQIQLLKKIDARQ